MFELVLMILADSMAVARQVQTLIFSKLGSNRYPIIGGSGKLLSASTFGRKFGTFHLLHQF
jgi:hypothetical protein